MPQVTEGVIVLLDAVLATDRCLSMRSDHFPLNVELLVQRAKCNDRVAYGWIIMADL